MPHKFMFIAVAGYVFFAFPAAVLATRPSDDAGPAHQFTIILLQWLAVTVFVLASLPVTLRIESPLALSALWPPPGGLLMALTGAIVASALSARRELAGWWSPMPWLPGLLMAMAVTAWADASDGVTSPLLPDWRFIGTSLVLWGVCLVLADMALFISRGPSDTDRSSRIVRELLRLCAVLPALLIFMIGNRL